MKRNPDVGAACGRIHPTGSGYMQWWDNWKLILHINIICQVPEVWVCNWTLASEGNRAHAWLCSLQVKLPQPFQLNSLTIISPGCFSLFRAKAVMDENVMHTYTTVASQPKHFVQYDQVKDPVRPGCSEKLQCSPTQPGGGPVAVHSAAEARLEGGIFCCKRLLHSLSGGEFFQQWLCSFLLVWLSVRKEEVTTCWSSIF